MTYLRIGDAKIGGYRQFVSIEQTKITDFVWGQKFDKKIREIFG